MIRSTISIACLALTAACSSAPTAPPYVLEGSRADASVTVGINARGFGGYGEQATDLAAQTCQKWGYSGAEAFGGMRSRCTAPGGYGTCYGWESTAAFQCIGQGNETVGGGVGGPAPRYGTRADGSFGVIN